MPETTPLPAGPWITGIGNTPNIPPQVQTNETAPDVESGAVSGLGGTVPTVGGPAKPQVEGPATPQPHETVARHILDALGGANPNDKMAWAKSILAGTLAGAANVGKVPEGAGFLAGAARGAQGVAAQKQLALENQRKQQEMDLKQKADARAEKELQIHMEDASVQRAMWNAQTAASIQTQQQNAARFPMLQKEDQLRARELQDNIQKSEQESLAVLSAAGVDITKLDHITGYDQLTSDHAKQAGAGGIFAVPNGEAHKEGEDGAGAYIVPGDVWERPISKPVTITTGYDVDKNGKATPKTMTATEGTKVGTLLAIAKGAQQDLAKKQDQIFKQAQLEHERAGTQKEIAETKLAESQIGQTPHTDILGGTITPPAGGIKETNKRMDAFKKDADELAKTEGTFNQFSDVLRDINAGKDMTGAQSVVALFNAIGISATPLKGMGMRINSNTVEEHENARGLGESAYQKFLKIKKGDVITPQQVKDYAEIAMRSRHDAYVNKINEARGQGIDPAFLLPRGNGRKIDTNTAQIFYDSAAGNSPQEKAANAKKAAQATGWNF
jgi:hypothetical protein